MVVTSLVSDRGAIMTKWTPKEEELLLHARIDLGEKCVEIAARIGKSLGAVTGKLMRLRDEPNLSQMRKNTDPGMPMEKLKPYLSEYIPTWKSIRDERGIA